MSRVVCERVYVCGFRSRKEMASTLQSSACRRYAMGILDACRRRQTLWVENASSATIERLLTDYTRAGDARIMRYEDRPSVALNIFQLSFALETVCLFFVYSFVLLCRSLQPQRCPPPQSEPEVRDCHLHQGAPHRR